MRMRRVLAALVLLVPATAACVPMMAASVAGMALRGANRPGADNSALKPQAEAACIARATPHGQVNVIDVQQKRPDLIIVWGTAGEGAARRSFECHFTSQVERFTLRAIEPAR